MAYEAESTFPKMLVGEYAMIPEHDSPVRRCANGGGDASAPQPTPAREEDLARTSRHPLKAGRSRQGDWQLPWFVILAAALAFLAWRAKSWCDPPDDEATPATAAEMAVFLRDKLPRARVVSTRADGIIDRSFLLTMGDHEDDELRNLPRVADRAGQWDGTVLCEGLVNWEPAELFLEQWGEQAFARPPFVFFGDKELLAQISEALR